MSLGWTQKFTRLPTQFKSSRGYVPPRPHGPTGCRPGSSGRSRAADLLHKFHKPASKETRINRKTFRSAVCKARKGRDKRTLWSHFGADVVRALHPSSSKTPFLGTQRLGLRWLRSAARPLACLGAIQLSVLSDRHAACLSYLAFV